MLKKIMQNSSQLEKLEKKFRKNPKSRLFFPLAESYRHNGEFDRAIELYRHGLKIHPNYVSARVSLGRTLIAIDRFDEAQKELEIVVSSVPENLMAHKLLADVYLSARETEAAIEQYQAVLELNPKDGDAQLKIDELLEISEDKAVEQSETMEEGAAEDIEVTFQPEEPTVTEEEEVEGGLEAAEQIEQAETASVFEEEVLEVREEKEASVSPAEDENHFEDEELSPEEIDLPLQQVFKKDAFEAEKALQPDKVPSEKSFEQNVILKEGGEEKPASIYVQPKTKHSNEFIQFLNGDNAQVTSDEVIEGKLVDKAENEDIEKDEVDFFEEEERLAETDDKSQEDFFKEQEADNIFDVNDSAEEIAEDVLFQTEPEKTEEPFDETETSQIEAQSSESIKQETGIMEITDDEDFEENDVFFDLEGEEELESQQEKTEEAISEKENLFFQDEQLSVEKQTSSEIEKNHLDFDFSTDEEEKAASDVLFEQAEKGEAVSIDTDETLDTDEALKFITESKVAAAKSEKSKTDGLNTLTMAQLYEQQGHIQEALSIYEKLSASAPTDTILKVKIESLKENLKSSTTEIKDEKVDIEIKKIDLSSMGKQKFIIKLEKLLNSVEKIKVKRGII